MRRPRSDSTRSKVCFDSASSRLPLEPWRAAGGDRGYRLLGSLNSVLEHRTSACRAGSTAFRLVWVTPDMHKVHHSRERSETDSNYANLFSFFDRLFGTFTSSSRGPLVRYGINGYDAPEQQSIGAVLSLPFRGLDLPERPSAAIPDAAGESNDRRSKRETLTLLGAGAAGLMVAGMAEAQNKTAARPEVRGSLKGGREPKPLTFDPAKLNGLSEKLIRSHWENNYVGSVKTLNLVSERLAAAMSDPELPPVLYGGLKREELHRVGSVILHEQYSAISAAMARPVAMCLPQSRRLTAATRHGKPSFVARRCRWPAAPDGVC